MVSMAEQLGRFPPVVVIDDREWLVCPYGGPECGRALLRLGYMATDALDVHVQREHVLPHMVARPWLSHRHRAVLFAENQGVDCRTRRFRRSFTTATGMTINALMMTAALNVVIGTRSVPVKARARLAPV